MPETKSQCPVCKLDDQIVESKHDYGDKITYQCARCGRFTISRTAKEVVDSTAKAAGLSAWLRERSVLGIDTPMLTSTFLKEILRTLPNYSPSEKQRRLLKAIEALTKYPGGEVELIPEHEAPLAWAENSEEFGFYVNSLIDRGLLELSYPTMRSKDDPLFPIFITADGWEQLERDQTDLTGKSQAFVAMSFDPSLLSIYEDAIAPAIESTGYTPFRVDGRPHLDRIDTKIIAEIRESRFLVADVTQQKTGVYYEAGYAHGLGIPVIWCVNRGDLENVHFDTRQYNHVLWDNVEELKGQLRSYILATIGAYAT